MCKLLINRLHSNAFHFCFHLQYAQTGIFRLSGVRSWLSWWWASSCSAHVYLYFYVFHPYSPIVTFSESHVMQAVMPLLIHHSLTFTHLLACPYHRNHVLWSKSQYSACWSIFSTFSKVFVCHCRKMAFFNTFASSCNSIIEPYFSIFLWIDVKWFSP